MFILVLPESTSPIAKNIDSLIIAIASFSVDLLPFEIAALQHELRNDTMKGRIFVSITSFAGAESAKIFYRSELELSEGRAFSVFSLPVVFGTVSLYN